MTTAYLLTYEVLEQSTDTLRNEILQKKTNTNGRLDAKEVEWLNSKPEIFYGGGFDILFKDMVEANKRQLTSDPIVMSVLDGISGSASWYQQVLDHNKGNKTQLDFIHKVGRRYNEAMKVANATKDINDRKLQRRVLAMNTLLMLNDYSKKDIGNLTVFSDSTFKAMHQYQKQYKTLYKDQNYSKADCIFGYRTAQQLCKNVGITPRGARVSEHFDSKKNAAALTIDKQAGFTKKQFVLDGFNLYKNYLVSLHKNMDMKGLTKMDEKLEATITNLDLNIKNISRTKVNDAYLDKKVDDLITNIKEQRSWMQNLMSASIPARLAKEDAYMERFKTLLKNPGSYQSARKDMVDIFSNLDKDALLLNYHSDAYQDLAREEMVNSREIYNNNKKIIVPEHNKNIVEERTVGRALQDIDKLFSDANKGSNDILIKMYDLIYSNRYDTQGNDNNPKVVGKLIATLIQQEVGKNPNQYKDLRNYIQTDVSRWDNFMGGNDIKNMVKMIQYNQNHLSARKDALKKDMTQEYNELLRYEAKGTLDPDQKPRLDSLKQLMTNGGIDENTLASALKASEITMMGSMLKDHMFYRVMDGKTDDYKDIIGHYDNIIGAGKGLSDKYANTAIDTTVLLAREIVIMSISGRLGALAERAVVEGVVRGAQIFRRVGGTVSMGRTAAIAGKSGLSAVEIAGVGMRNGKMINRLRNSGRIVAEGAETATMSRRIGGVASFLSKGSLITESSLELARSYTGWVSLMKLARYATNGTVFHLSSSLMTNTIDGNDLSEGMTPTDFAKSIAFIWILSEISSVFRFVLPLNNPRQAAEILNKPQAVAWKTLNTSSIFRKLGVAATEVTTEVTALLGTSRAVSVLFGENHEELSSNEIAHTIAIVLGMKGFHGLVTIKDARRGLIVYEGKPYDLKTDLTKDSPKNESKETSNNKEKSNKKNTTENFEFEEIKTKTPEEKSKKVQDEINIILETKLQNHNENELQSMINKEKDPTTSPTARAKLKKQLDQLDQIALKEFKDKKAEKNWLNKQFSTHQEYIREASEIISKSSNILPLSLIGLKDLTTISKEEIKNIQREIGLKGEQIDGILGPKTLESLKNYVNEIKTNKNQTYEQTNSQKSEKDNTKKETKTDPESIFRESEKMKTEKEAIDILETVEREIKDEKIPDAKAESILDKLTDRYKSLSESLKKSPLIIAKISSLIASLVTKIGNFRKKQTLNKMQSGEVKMPKSIENLPKKDLDMVMQANLMQENLPKFKKVAEFLDGGFVGKEWLISSLGFIPLLGNIGVTWFGVIQASIASYYGFKMKLGDSFQYNNLKRQGWDTLLGNIPGVGMVADIIYKANRYNLKEMMWGYRSVIEQLEAERVGQEFIDHHVKMYEQLSGKKFK